MDQFKKLYHEYCKTYHVEPNDLLLGEIQKVSGEDNKTKSLNLSSFNIPEAQCSILGKILTHDFIFTSIQLNDCNLSSDALSALLHGLMTNATCKILELKGNGIQGSGTEALSKVLRKNQTIRTLRLEWNQIGSMNSPAFSIFCDALADNKALIDLDLRNNDINHVGASELASALKRNTTLRAIDLRWNNVGLIGGRALLAVCESNATLNELQIIGNNVPDDIMQSIANALSKNTEHRKMHFEHSQNMTVLSRQLQNVHEEKDREITTTLTRMSLQEQAMLKANKSLAEKLKKLQEALDDRKLAFNALSAKYTELEASITVAKQENDDLLNKMKKMEIGHHESVHQIQRDHKQEKDDLIHMQDKLQRDLKESLDVQRRLTEKIHDLERKNEKLQTTVHELHETIAMNDRTHQIKLTSSDDEIQRLKLKHKEDLKDHELVANRDIQRLKEAHTASEQTLKEQLSKLENIRITLEREINSLKSTSSTQKLHHDELLQQERIRIKNDEEKKQQELEDRLRTLTSLKDELESRNNQQSIAYRELQQKLNFQSVEIESLKRQIASVELTIHAKDSEIIETREKIKTDYEKKFRSIQQDIDLNGELKQRVKQLENELKDQHFTDQNTIRELQSRLAELQTTLTHRDQEISRLKLEEEHRLQFLRSAIVDYIGTGTDH
ncbi:unnamed protein product [Rotaria magnacalcarata]|uniref:Leucine-rich repeat-containing protein 45 n=1 Tax=Rotaria magnacalcarata TaxID=392030 RepID=A0A820DS41_9BILA|nr:unnamed protein product [Rotaria magnacalcarata]CAF4236791.1 unnamed protein product [Rotaria magnacalcarata]